MNFATCQQCALKPGLCHGFEGDWDMEGCSVFDHSKCEKHKWTCACNLDRLGARVMEVRNFQCKLEMSLLPIGVDLPHYIPSFYHGFPEANALELEWVALPLHCLFKSESGDGIKCFAKNGSELRAFLGLHRNTRIILTGPGPDQLIEDFWRFHRHSNLLSLLKELDIQLFTVPNYSFFTDAPPLHHHYNRGRILRVAERAAEAGVPSVLHLNAIHEQTWQGWEDLIKNHGEIDHVCMEFQTGYTSPKVAQAALDRLVKVQEKVQRPLHPILIGAGRYSGFIGENFTSSTIVDAQPFLNTFNRKIHRTLPDGKSRWHFKSTEPLESLIPRFKWNLREHSERIGQRLAGVRPERQTEFELPLDPAGPLVSRHKQKPVAALPLFGRKQSERTSALVAVSNSSPSNAAPVANRTAIGRIPNPSTPKSAATLPNSRHKNNRRKLQPNGFDGANKTGVAVGH